ncbi:hypothetical protein MXB_5321, partial [Myxobolus squamalis]
MKKSIQRIDLEQSLLNPQFEGYKILTESTHVEQIKLIKNTSEIYNSLKNVDILSSKMNTLMNQLFFHENSFYYFSGNGNELVRIHIHGGEPSFSYVFNTGETTPLFSPSIHFMKDNTKIIFDGSDTILVLNNDYQLINKFLLQNTAVAKHIYSATKSGDIISIVSAHVQFSNDQCKPKNTCRVTVNKFDGKNFSNSSYEFNDFPVSFDLINPQIAVAILDSIDREYPDNPKTNGIPLYTWSQTSDLIHLHINPSNFGASIENFEVILNFDRVYLNKNEFLLSNIVDSDSSRLVSANETIEISLIKKVSGFWKELFTNDSRGAHNISGEEQQYIQSLVQCMEMYTSAENNEQMSHLSSIYDDAFSEPEEIRDYYVSLYDTMYKKPSQEISLSTGKILYSKFDPHTNFLKACIQRDVDGIV